MGRWATQWTDTFIVYLADMHVPSVEARRPAQNSGARHCLPPDFGHVRAHVSPDDSRAVKRFRASDTS
jgi:hypothetical protein